MPWTEAAANAWYAARAVPLGCNFVPSTAVNQLEMWQAETFDLATIDRELGLAAGLGMNAVRVFLHDLLWADPTGCVARLDAFLGVAAKHGLAVVPVLFESCWNPEPVAGLQPPPKPGVHNSRWVQAPGKAGLLNPAERPRLEAYATGVVAAFAHDPRVLLWDVWNEPENGPEVDLRDPTQLAKKAGLVLPLLDLAFDWVRAAGPDQPLTSAVWSGDWSSPLTLTPIQRCQLDRSDVISFHNYDGPEAFAQKCGQLAARGRPVICTEYLARPRGNTFAAIVPVAREHKLGLFNWGLVTGKTQTNLPWSSVEDPISGPVPEPWFHDIFEGDGTLHDPAEAEVLRG